MKGKTARGRKAFVLLTNVRELESGNSRPLKTVSLKDLNPPPKLIICCRAVQLLLHTPPVELLSSTAHEGRKWGCFLEKQESKRMEQRPPSRGLRSSCSLGQSLPTIPWWWSGDGAACCCDRLRGRC